MRRYTLDDLKLMSPVERAVLYQNATKLRDNGGQAVIDLIESSGLSLRSGGTTLDDPVYLRMEEIIWSNEGRDAAKKATAMGLPALAGVEPLLQAALRERYSPHDMGTVSAGSIVGALMRHLGYVQAGEAKLPDNCVAKTAMRWKFRD